MADNGSTSGSTTDDATGSDEIAKAAPNKPSRGHDPSEPSSKPANSKDRRSWRDPWTLGPTSAIAVGGLVSAAIFAYQLREMRIATDLTRETLIASQRPWISLQMEISGPLTFNSNGAEIGIDVQLKNRGHSPAVNVRNFVILDVVAGSHKGADVCEQQRNRIATNFTHVIFPDETIFDSHRPRAEIAEVKLATHRRDTVSPLITACVYYTSQFDGSRHQTVIVANLVRRPTAEDESFAIKVKEGSIPRSQLNLDIFFGISEAD